MLAPNAKLRAMVVPQEPEPPPAQQAKPVECEANCAHHRTVRLSSHRYRASAGVRAINELRPLIGLELTATPFVETTKGPVRIPEKIRKRYGKDIGKRYWGDRKSVV